MTLFQRPRESVSKRKKYWVATSNTHYWLLASQVEKYKDVTFRKFYIARPFVYLLDKLINILEINKQMDAKLCRYCWKETLIKMSFP